MGARKKVVERRNELDGRVSLILGRCCVRLVRGTDEETIADVSAALRSPKTKKPTSSSPAKMFWDPAAPLKVKWNDAGAAVVSEPMGCHGNAILRSALWKRGLFADDVRVANMLPTQDWINLCDATRYWTLDQVVACEKVSTMTTRAPSSRRGRGELVSEDRRETLSVKHAAVVRWIFERPELPVEKDRWDSDIPWLVAQVWQTVAGHAAGIPCMFFHRRADAGLEEKARPLLAVLNGARMVDE